MTASRVANRYAEAILDALPETTDREAFFADLRDLETSIRESRELQLFFESPVISRTRKTEAVGALFGDRLQPYLVQVLSLLVEKRREDIILDIIAALHAIRRERMNIRLSTVTSAVILGEEQKATLQKVLEQAADATVEASWHVDPSLKGGVVVRLEDTVFDGSVAHQLDRLRSSFATGK